MFKELLQKGNREEEKEGGGVKWRRSSPREEWEEGQVTKRKSV